MLEVSLNHEEYVERLEGRQIAAFVDMQRAIGTCGMILITYQLNCKAYTNSRRLFFIVPLAALVSFFFVPWYIGVLLFLAAMLYGTLKTIPRLQLISRDCIIEAACLHEDLYYRLTSERLLYLTRVP